MNNFHATLCALAALAFMMGCIFGAIMYSSSQETVRMKACVESGQKWVIDDRTYNHECTK